MEVNNYFLGTFKNSFNARSWILGYNVYVNRWLFINTGIVKGYRKIEKTKNKTFRLKTHLFDDYSVSMNVGVNYYTNDDMALNLIVNPQYASLNLVLKF